MDTYKNIGQRIRDVRESRGETQEDVARLLGYNQATVAGYESGRRRISIQDLQTIADHYGVSVNYFLGKETKQDQIATEVRRAREELEEARRRLDNVTPYSGGWLWLPLIGTIPAGYREWQEEDEAEEFYPCSVAQIKRRDGAYALRVKGDSMVKQRIFDGDIIFVDGKGRPKPGDLIVARKDDQVDLRLYKLDDKGPYLESGNDRDPVLRLNEARVLGVVVGSYRERP